MHDLHCLAYLIIHLAHGQHLSDTCGLGPARLISSATAHYPLSLSHLHTYSCTTLKNTNRFINRTLHTDTGATGSVKAHRYNMFAPLGSSTEAFATLAQWKVLLLTATIPNWETMSLCWGKLSCNDDQLCALQDAFQVLCVVVCRFLPPGGLPDD